MKYLGFTRANIDAHGKRIAEVCFDERSALPTSAACVVASGVRETLSALFECVVRLHLFEPVVPSPDAWCEIGRDAMLYRMNGSIADAAVVLRPADATTLAAAAFGERGGDMRALSAIERTVVERTVRAIGANLASVCGTRDDDPASTTLADLRGFVTYFELALAAPVECRIGIALSRDPQAEPHGTLRIDDLLDLPLEVSARVELPAMTAAALLDLRRGEILPMTSTARPLAGRLTLSGCAIGNGECGVSADRYAIALCA